MPSSAPAVECQLRATAHPWRRPAQFDTFMYSHPSLAVAAEGEAVPRAGPNGQRRRRRHFSVPDAEATPTRRPNSAPGSRP